MRSGCLWLTHQRAEAALGWGDRGAASALTTGGMLGMPVAAPKIAHHRLSDQRPLCERVEAL